MAPSLTFSPARISRELEVDALLDRVRADPAYAKYIADTGLDGDTTTAKKH